MRSWLSIRRPVVNAMTIDVEDYFHVSVFDGVVPRHHWEGFESRVCANTDRLLELFDELRGEGDVLRARLGRRAPSGPGAADRRRRARNRVARLRPPARLRPDAEGVPRGRPPREGSARRRSRDAPVLGYRAPSYSITPRSLWALDILIEEGYRYDSSIFPIRHDRYGIPLSPAPPVSARAASRRPGRGARLDDPGRSAQPAGRGRRVLPHPALRVDALGHQPREPARAAARRFSTCTPGKSIRSSPGSRPALLSRFRHYRNLGRDRGAPPAPAERLPFRADVCRAQDGRSLRRSCRAGAGASVFVVTTVRTTTPSCR